MLSSISSRSGAKSFQLSSAARAGLQKVASTTTDNRQVETAFADMVSVAVSNKAGPLLNNGRHIGFEIIKQNDDNTHMLGVSVFRLGNSSTDDLVYAPVIFSNGKIVGSNLLYRVGPKKFVPFKPEWCQFLMDVSSRGLGRPVLKSETAKLVPATNWHMLSTPPGNLKAAKASNRITDPAAVDEMMDLITKRGHVEPLLRDFMIANGSPALQILINTAEARPKFAAALAALGDDAFMPHEMIAAEHARRRAAMVKEAAANQPTLVLLSGPPDLETCKLAGVDMNEQLAARLYKRGYSVETPAKTPVPEHQTIACEGTPEMQFVSPGPAGKANLMLASGELVEVVIGDTLDTYELLWADNGVPSACAPSSSCDSIAPTKDRTAVALKRPGCYSGRRPLYVMPALDGGLETVGASLGDIEAPGLFTLVDPVKGRITKPLWVASAKKGDDGVLELSVASYQRGDCSPLIFNPGLQDSDVLRAGVLGPKWRAVKLPYEKPTDAGDQEGLYPSTNAVGGATGKRAPSWVMAEMVPATSADIRQHLRRKLPRVKAASLVSHPDGLFDLTVGDTVCKAESRRGVAVKLACLQVDPAVAEQLLDNATEQRLLRFSLDFEKTAGLLQVMDQPRFQQRFDSVHNMPLEVPQAFTLRTYKTPMVLPAPRIGDKMPLLGEKNRDAAPPASMHEVPQDLILNGSPEEIGAYAQQVGAPHVFDHAVLGSLARTYDSAKLLEGFIPKLEDGLDALGRSIFLFYWRPEDWKNLYGVDDLVEIEQKLNSVFDSTGDVVLDLLKKTRTAAAT